jgi:hypothetical protein
MHPAFPPPGQAVPAWEAAVKLSTQTGVRSSGAGAPGVLWTSAREVFQEMTQKVPAFAAAKWGREIRPVQLRFAASRG